MIEEFRGEYGFLSNFYYSPLEMWGIRFPTVEHAFQACKTTDPQLRQKIADSSTPQTAKRMGRKLKLREDWEDVKVIYMYTLLKQKFSDKNLRIYLLSTGNEKLVEGNWWKDRVWGVYDGE